MTGLITEPILRNERLGSLGLDAVNSPGADVRGAQAEDAWLHNPTRELMGMHARALTEMGVYDEAGNQILPPARMIPKDVVNEIYGIPGQLAFENDTAEPVAIELYNRKREELRRQDVMQRSEGGFLQGATGLGIGLAVSAVDPLNVASAFLPVVGPARSALWLARAEGALGRAAVRAQIGAIEGAAGAALVEPIVYLGARSEHEDYTAVDSLLNIAVGSALGGGLHAAAGAIGDRLSRAPVETREAALRSSLAELAETGTVQHAEIPLRQILPETDPAVAEFNRLFNAPAGRLEGAQHSAETGTLAAAPATKEWKSADKILPGERPILEGLAAEVETAAPASRQFTTLADNDPARGQGRGLDYGGPVTGIPSERPRWFQQIQAQEHIAPQQLRPVIEKMLDGKPLAVREQRIAEAAMSRVREIREENVRAMLAARQQRDAAALADAHEMGRREEEFWHGDPADLELSKAHDQAIAGETPAAKAGEIDPRLTDDIAKLSADLKRLEAAGLVEKNSPELQAAAELKQQATVLGKIFDAAAFCMGRR